MTRSCCLRSSDRISRRRRLSLLYRRIRFSPFLCLLTALPGCAAAGGANDGSRSAFGAKGAPWTILCLELPGETRLRDIEQFAHTLRNTPGIRAKEVIIRDEGDGVARLYYGEYRWPPARDGKPAPMPKVMRDDLTMLRQLGDVSERRYFLRAVPVRKPTADVGNPEWALKNAKGVYTLQIAVFEPNDEFFEYKQAAAEFCKFLREKGYEAYYHHTSAASMVTVGSFGPEAVIKPSAEAAHREFLRKGAAALPVYSSQVTNLQKDELLRYNLRNGGIEYVHKANGERVAVLSRLVEIPHLQTPAP